MSSLEISKESMIRDFINRRDFFEDKETLLFKAVKNGDLELVKNLITLGADINVTNLEGDSPLFMCARYESKNNIKIAKYLIEFGADINLKNKRGETVLFEAVFNAECDLIKYLVESGANINVQNNERSTILSHVSKLGTLSLIKYFMENGAKESLNLKDNRGNTPICNVILFDYTSCHLNVIKYFVESGADINIKNNGGITPLDLAIVRNRKTVSDYLKTVIDGK